MERIRIDMSLLLNDYPPTFISMHTTRFFEQCNALPVVQQLDAQIYDEFHHKLLHQQTRREKQQQLQKLEIGQMPASLTKRKTWDLNIMYARYQFESGPRIGFRREFRAWWETYYGHQESRVAHVKVKFAPKRNRTLEHSLVHKKPPRDMLTKIESTV